jgi:small subunit ribosomal protein S12
MPGYDYFCVKYNRVLVNGGRANDVPGVSHTVIRGVYDFTSLLMKKKRRSVYGVGQPEGYSSHIRRKDRNIKL